MTKFTVTISDPDQIAGITSAREAHNLSSPSSLLADDAAYVQFVMENAAASYASQYADPVVIKDKIIAEKDAEIAAKAARIVELEVQAKVVV